MRNRADLLLSGNEAMARDAYEAGVTIAAGYPGIILALLRFLCSSLLIARRQRNIYILYSLYLF